MRGTPVRLLVLTAAVALTALAAAAVGLTLPVRLPADDPLGGPARFGIAVAVFALAQLARLRFRSAAGMVSITWGEAALIVCLYLAPAGWLPVRHAARHRAGLDDAVAARRPPPGPGAGPDRRVADRRRRHWPSP